MKYKREVAYSHNIFLCGTWRLQTKSLWGEIKNILRLYRSLVMNAKLIVIRKIFWPSTAARKLNGRLETASTQAKPQILKSR